MNQIEPTKLGMFVTPSRPQITSNTGRAATTKIFLACNKEYAIFIPQKSIVPVSVPQRIREKVKFTRAEPREKLVDNNSLFQTP